MNLRTPLHSLLLACVLHAAVLADDWPQWRGPNRDGVWSETGIIEKFDGPEIKPRWTADECFLTGTAAEVVPVVKVDSRTIGDGTPGKITRQLMAQFKKLTRS